jgi:spectinomycin phosphotransferase
VRSLPADLDPERLRHVLADAWRIRVGSLEYLPEGGGAYHWKLTDDDGRRRFVTVDDLDDKDWLGHTRRAVLDGLGRALDTAAALRHHAGLEFVVAPVATSDGQLLRPIDGRYTVSVFPFLAGRSHPFGPYADERLRDDALEMLAALHRSTAVVRDCAPSHRPSFTGRGEFDAFLRDPSPPWEGGPFSTAAHELLTPRVADLVKLTTGFDHLVDLTSVARANQVITHGEPHPANLMSADGRLHLIDWDTAALAPAERDLSLVATAGGVGIERYQEITGRRVEPAVMTLYRVRWYLDDISSTVRLFRNRHRDTADTRRWWQGLAPCLERLPEWLDLLGQAG